MTVLLQQRGLIEAPIYAALNKFCRRPSERDALKALYDEHVQRAAIKVAEDARLLAREEDIRRDVEKRSRVSYRKFYVSAVAIGLVLSGSGYEWWVFTAVNSKPSKKACKFCAEMRCMRAAREAGVSCIGGYVVIGERQPDGRSGKQRNTLDPCGECRDCMRDPKNAVRHRRATVIVTKQPESQFGYLEVLHKMMAAHGETWP